MAGVLDTFREVMTLTATTGALRADVDRLFQKVEDHHERIIRLEERENTLKKEMAIEAMVGVQRLTLDLTNRVNRIEQSVRISTAEPGKQLE